MALTGVTSLGYVEPEASAVLLTLSTALTVSTRTRRGVIQARTPAFGDFAALPFTVGAENNGAGASKVAPTIGSLLSVRGITEYVAAQGVNISSTSELWQSDEVEILRVRQAFTAALETAILVAAITTDPCLLYTSRCV